MGCIFGCMNSNRNRYIYDDYLKTQELNTIPLYSLRYHTQETTFPVSNLDFNGYGYYTTWDDNKYLTPPHCIYGFS